MSGSAKSASRAPSGSAANASSVGANTVNSPDSSARVASKPAASRAVTSVSKLPESLATSSRVPGPSSGVPAEGLSGAGEVELSLLSQAASAPRQKIKAKEELGDQPDMADDIDGAMRYVTDFKAKIKQAQDYYDGKGRGTKQSCLAYNKACRSKLA